jgi:hypothetical protein
MDLEAGAERQVCKLVLADAKLNLNWSEGLFTSGSHHALVLRTPYRDALPAQNIRNEAVDASEVADCVAAGSDWNIGGVIAGGRAVDGDPGSTFPNKGDLPDDVAIKIESNEVLEINFHMLNATTKATHACYKANLYSIPDAQVNTEAGVMFYYNNFITIPANGTFKADMACPVTQDVTLAAQVSHMHQRGTNYSASLLDGDPLAGGSEVQKLYETTQWEEPAFKVNSPALALKQGQWIRWSCDYVNPEARDVAQGQQTTDEMCMFVGAYWPRSNEMDWCMPLGGTQFYTGARPLGQGTMNGADFANCWAQSPQIVGGGGPDDSADRFATQRCFTDTCPAVSGLVNEAYLGTVDITTVTCN